jgi:hypothetical protein
MNVVRNAILRACWQDENQAGLQAARPWLRRFLTRVVGMDFIPDRESERTKIETQSWLAARREEGRTMNPETAQVVVEYVQMLDPYGIKRHLAEHCVGRQFFARSPGSDEWVWCGDLPDAVHDRLRERLEAGEFVEDDNVPW